MNARDAGPQRKQTRLAAARATARRLIRDMRHGDRLTIVEAGEWPRLLIDLTGQRRALRHAVDAIGAPAGRTRLDAATTAAAELLARSVRPRVVLLTDGCNVGGHVTVEKRRASPAAKSQHPTFHVQRPISGVWRVGRASANVGVARLAARRNLGRPTECDVFVRVVNHGGEAASRALRFVLGGRPIAGSASKIELPADGQFERTFQFQLPRAGRLRAEISAADVLPDDDYRRVAVPPPALIHVEPVGELSPMLTAALESNPFVVLNPAPGDELPGPGTPVVRVAEGRVPPQTAGPLLLVNPPEGFQPASLQGKVASEDDALTRIDRPSGRVVVANLTDPHQPQWPKVIGMSLSWIARAGPLSLRERSRVRAEHWRDAGGTDGFPAAESELRAPADVGRPASEIAGEPPGPPPWTYLAALAAALAVAQWCLFQRRWLS